MKYENYWSILETPSNSISPDSIFLILSIISLLAFFIILKFKKVDNDKKFLLFLNGLFILLSLPAFIHLRFFVKNNTEQRITEFLNSTKVQKVEGKISNFKRNIAYPRSGKTTTESFEVDTVKFEYYDNALSEFNQFGGNNSKYLYDGLKVRIAYLKGNKNEIQKIEIEKN